ncbi:unnamed protein product, partial [Ectocarpus sp. 13 AM-2016]
WLSSHLLLLHLHSHHKSRLTPPEHISPNKHVHPCLAKAAKPPAPIPTHRPPPLDPLRRLLLLLLLPRPPPAHGAGSSASAGSSTGSPEQFPADRELQYRCPRTGSNTNLFLKKNIREDRADYPACRNFRPAPARGPAF